ncbi:uncharacterized protein EDB93DRAFT_1254373 [Suillus bovinus]|uniref:uncharacterized protein n=1 Tax=Suillus bovinus TaxID=48563 RepID=UPI001B86DEE9|nr:uncharacterized protein EDB93DRAFT_1257575 [Suillus bovinus]XP_041303678.1 uncharacterized protein EDB93DRAFT_1254373 [Suillus bovinus]KAG2126351.1 hypothetical protein EDB93DRAFT_1257575 [Suillus bovinus]KAG2135237.1 hypothetical protein EDB93DRAFT_1254373 [Suillus bovinus]
MSENVHGNNYAPSEASLEGQDTGWTSAHEVRSADAMSKSPMQSGSDMCAYVSGVDVNMKTHGSEPSAVTIITTPKNPGPLDPVKMVIIEESTDSEAELLISGNHKRKRTLPTACKSKKSFSANTIKIADDLAGLKITSG